MMNLETNRRAAIVFGIGGPCMQAFRVFYWGGPAPTVAQWPIALDAYVAGGLLLAGALIASRQASAGRTLLAAGWGFAAGVLYRSFFEQVADPSRHGGHEWLVMAAKGALLAGAIGGLAGAVRGSTSALEPRRIGDDDASGVPDVKAD
jgi:hypothetical protein